jgi:CRISPR-associated protein Csd2
VRDYIQRRVQELKGYDIYVKHRGILGLEQKKAYEACKILPENKSEDKQTAKRWMCENYFDIRAFGAVMTVGKAKSKSPKPNSKEKETSNSKEKETLYNCGQVRGPVQLGIARSLDPICSLDIALTRVALTNASDIEKEKEAIAAADDATEARAGQMARKSIVPYAMYRVHGFVNPHDAQQSGFGQYDLNLFFEALARMFDVDHSASRDEMSTTGLFVFVHEDPTGIGSCPSKFLFQKVVCKKREGVEFPRQESDYDGPRFEGPPPAGVQVLQWDFSAGKLVG